MKCENIKGNAIVGQSGGPTAAINATLSGVIQGALESDNVGEIYGMLNGIDGLLKERLVSLNERFADKNELRLLENTPAAALGSCRVRLPDANENEENRKIYEHIFDILDRKNIKYFFYIGGNDSMDTVKKLNSYAKKYKNSSSIKIIGVPKTIDNDLSSTDHSPGYGSAAKYIATTMQEVCLDNSVYNQKSALIVEIMGRDAGWLTAAAALPRLCGGRAADLIYLPEVEFSNDKFIADIEKQFAKKANIVIAVSEGIKYADGTYVCETKEKHETDIFGHLWLSGTADTLKQLMREKLNCKIRAAELNTPQRCAGHISSLCDITEAVMIGKKAVETAAERGKSGVMMTFKRIQAQPYKIEIGCEDISNIANSVRTVPHEYITPEANNVTDECLEYILPLIMGEPDIVYKNGLPVYFKL